MSSHLAITRLDAESPTVIMWYFARHLAITLLLLITPQSFKLVDVPEPASFLLLWLGAIMMLCCRIRFGEYDKVC